MSKDEEILKPELQTEPVVQIISEQTHSKVDDIIETQEGDRQSDLNVVFEQRLKKFLNESEESKVVEEEYEKSSDSDDSAENNNEYDNLDSQYNKIFVEKALKEKIKSDEEASDKEDESDDDMNEEVNTDIFNHTFIPNK